MNTTPLVDVAIVTYNHEQFVAQAIEGVLSQRFAGECRLIIGDDCSTDKTQAILEDYAQRYLDRITTIFSSEHFGLAHKERVGLRVLERCTAKYVAFLDGDDYWTDPLKLQKQVDFLESHPDFAVCFHNVKVSYEDQGQEPWNYCPPDQKEISTIEDLLDRNFIATSSTVFRRECLGELPNWFLKIKTGDWLLHILNAQNGKVGYIDEVMSVYRIHHAGYWSKQDMIQNSLDEIVMFKVLGKHLPKKYRAQIKSHLASLFYQLANEYNSRGDKGKAVISAFKCLGANPRDQAILVRHVLDISFPRFISRVKSLLGWKTS
jgi:glycosyltransferase involved in cell wall biosynthesis